MAELGANLDSAAYSAADPTLREKIAENLREAIIRGELKPGARLQEVEVALSHNTSRTPVREAFQQLESEGFLTIRPRRGAYVAPLTVQDIQEFYEIKGVLEGYAARIAADRLTEAQIDRMQQLNDELARCFERADVAAIVPVHNEFHDIFVSACGNGRLAALITSLVKQFQRFRIALSHTPAVAESIAIHREIVAAFRNRNAERAADLVTENSRQGCDALLKALALNGHAGSGSEVAQKVPQVEPQHDFPDRR
jgi:DNA-binding GntR family transcriptional regulator